MLNPRHIRLSDKGIDRSLEQRPIRPPPAATPPALAVALGGVIRRVRQQAWLSQRQLATQLGLSRSAISRWESGRRFPTISHLERLGELIDRPASSMLTEAEEIVRITRQAARREPGAGPDPRSGCTAPHEQGEETDDAADD